MSDLSNGFSGQCLCGQASYSCSSAPLNFVLCHCRDCQRISGGGPAPCVMVPEAAVELSGELKKYESKADTGRSVVRQFCPECGTQVFSDTEMAPGIRVIKAGTLDDPSQLKVAAEIWVDSSQPWQAKNPEAKQIPGQPEAKK